MSQELEEEEFNKWIESIEFVDRNGDVMPTKLEEDESDDPYGDRE